MSDDNIIPLYPGEDSHTWNLRQMAQKILEICDEELTQDQVDNMQALVIMVDKGPNGDGYFRRTCYVNISTSDICHMCATEMADATDILRGDREPF